MRSLNRYNDYLLEKMWKELKKLSFTTNEAGENILPFSWEGFPKGSRKTDILEFFEQNYSNGLQGLSEEYKQKDILFLW